MRENIAKELGLKRGFIYIVDDTSGTLWNDNKEIKDPPETLSLMIAFYENRWEETPDGDDKNGTNDVGGDTGTSDRRLMRCASNEEMECTHFKGIFYFASNNRSKWFLIFIKDIPYFKLFPGHHCVNMLNIGLTLTQT